MIIALFFLLLAPSVFAAEGSGYTNNISFAVGQDYIISSDVLSKAGIVAGQFDGIIDPSELPDDYGDQLEEYQDDAMDQFEEYAPDYLGFGETGRGNQMLNNTMDLMGSSTNSAVFRQFGVALTNQSSEGLGVGATNLVPASMPNGLTNGLSKLADSTTGSALTDSAFTGLYKFGGYGSDVSTFWVNIPLTDTFRLECTLSGGKFAIFSRGIHFCSWVCVRLTALFLLFLRAREGVKIFTSGEK